MQPERASGQRCRSASGEKERGHGPSQRAEDRGAPRDRVGPASGRFTCSEAWTGVGQGWEVRAGLQQVLDTGSLGERCPHARTRGDRNCSQGAEAGGDVWKGALPSGLLPGGPGGCGTHGPSIPQKATWSGAWSLGVAACS